MYTLSNFIAEGPWLYFPTSNEKHVGEGRATTFEKQSLILTGQGCWWKMPYMGSLISVGMLVSHWGIDQVMAFQCWMQSKFGFHNEKKDFFVNQNVLAWRSCLSCGPRTDIVRQATKLILSFALEKTKIKCENIGLTWAVIRELQFLTEFPNTSVHRSNTF